MVRGVSGEPPIESSWYRATPLSRTAARLIVVVFSNVALSWTLGRSVTHPVPRKLARICDRLWASLGPNKDLSRPFFLFQYRCHFCGEGRGWVFSRVEPFALFFEIDFVIGAKSCYVISKFGNILLISSCPG